MMITMIGIVELKACPYEMCSDSMFSFQNLSNA